jgi:hypothetical protein
MDQARPTRRSRLIERFRFAAWVSAIAEIEMADHFGIGCASNVDALSKRP